MARRTPAAPPPDEPAVEQAPAYDPAAHTDPDQLVFLELFCLCGAIRRQRDPVSFVAAALAEWTAQHGGDGHGPATKAAAVAEREARSEAALRAVGAHGNYRRGDYPHLDDTDEQPRPWPALPGTED